MVFPKGLMRGREYHRWMDRSAGTALNLTAVPLTVLHICFQIQGQAGRVAGGSLNGPPMRRLAKHSRKDAYATRRDYQTLHKHQGLALVPSGKKPDICTITFCPIDLDAAGCLGVGGYLAAPSGAVVRVTVISESEPNVREFHVGTSWTRVGAAFDISTAGAVVVSLSWPAKTMLNVWGLNAGIVRLPEGLGAATPTAASLGASHLCPETLYLTHESAMLLEPNPESSSVFATAPGMAIALKKCSYCGRLLPINPRKLGTLAFHKHLAKVSKHQNECRACKKWRINDEFNPARTTDQLHESSVITRERKLFLREPEILQQIKLRTGAGLKSQVWERFGRKCFYCKKPLALDEVHLDHTRPLAYLWPLDVHATCLCAPHNNQKQDKFPVDFYTDAQLHELSAICGLPYDELRRKRLNPSELRRLRRSLQEFAREWDPRTFAATARKIAELRPEIDLLKELEAMNAALGADLRAQIAQRPNFDE